MRTPIDNDFRELDLAVGRFFLVLYRELVKPIVDWIVGWFNRITERIEKRLGGDN